MFVAWNLSVPLIGNAKDPPSHDIIAGLSFIEIGRQKDSNHTYVNRVLMSVDGRKRTESLTNKSGLVSLYDNWGIQRLYLNPLNKTATVFEAVEPDNSGTNLDEWIAGIAKIKSSANHELGTKKLGNESKSGFSWTTRDNNQEVWFDDETGSIRDVVVDSTEQEIRLMNIQFHDSLDAALFSFLPPEGFTIAERHLTSAAASKN